MLEAKIFTTSPFELNSSSFYPRNYSPNFLFVKNAMKDYPMLGDFLSEPLKGGSTPPAYLFTDKESGIPFVKTSAILHHFINTNDLYYINEKFHRTTIKRSITKPYDVVYSMTGKFMGKAALCPPTISELNMSQNSVVLKTDSPLKSAYLTIFLNSEINKIQVKGSYSITKQKFLNQGKISQLRIVPYSKEYDPLLEDYINAIDDYYTSLKEIESIISAFNTNNNLVFDENKLCSFSVSPISFNKKMLVPNYYRTNIAQTIASLESSERNLFDKDNLSKGDEIGSENYLESGTPFIKTSDIMNYDVDNEPNCYCAKSFINELCQDIKKGDIIFTKDGKPGEVAIIEENANIVISSGLAKYRPKDDDELYWLFLLLSSKYGSAYFKKWFVIASTMTHLRKDFFEDFNIPELTTQTKTDYIMPLKTAFKKKKCSYDVIMRSRDEVIERFLLNQ